MAALQAICNKLQQRNDALQINMQEQNAAVQRCMEEQSEALQRMHEMTREHGGYGGWQWRS